MSGLTPWFDGAKHKPARKGVYQLMNGTGTHVGYQYWDGKHWMAWEETAERAHRYRDYGKAADAFQNDNWRGLLKARQS